MKAMILAAGRGSRMRPLTDSTPKPLLKVGCFSLIEHLLIRLRDQGFQEIVINVAYLGDKIIATLGSGKRFGLKIQYSMEQHPEGLETGGGIFNALPLLGDSPFLVLSGDIWTDYNFSSLKRKNLVGSVAHLVLVDNPPDHARGDFNLDGDRLCLVQGKRLTFGNIGVYHPDLFRNCQPGFFPLRPLLVEAIQKGLVTGEYYSGSWINVSTPAILACIT
jgi:MurNAc alpha-1-phosphate uridylyltransferase